MNLFIGFSLFTLVLGVLALVGYILNIVKLITSKEFMPLTVVRIIGIFIPVIGCIVGFVG